MTAALSPAIPSAVATYLRKRAVSTPWEIQPPPTGRFEGAIVIPALAECANLGLTLRSLVTNPPEILKRYLILVVVNHRADASLADKESNRETLLRLSDWRNELSLPHLCWVDAASTGRELPEKQGVGLARKTGMDLALPFLDYTNRDPLLICLDADTLVQPDYLPAITAHFSASSAGGAGIPYCHQKATDASGQSAIDRYELFLRSYVFGLRQAGSPYAFHTVGSAMACRASAYVASGGMNRRLAGEDFYFLQQLHKVAGVTELTGTCVHPSPRSSHRVPFGTGRAVGDMLAAGEQDLMFYRPELFAILQEWLECVAGHGRRDSDALLTKAAAISPHLADFLRQAGFDGAWENMLRHNPEQQRLTSAFHGWFDAFRTMRLMHHLTDSGFSRMAPEVAVPLLLERAGYGGASTVQEMLVWLRERQGAGT